MPCFAIKAGFLSRVTARVRWNSDMLRIMLFADINGILKYVMQ